MADTASIPIVVDRPLPSASAARRTQGVLLGVGSALTFSLSGPLVKPLLEAGWSLSATLVLRMGLAAVILSPALVLAVRRERSFLRRHWRALVAFGLVPVVGCQLFYFSAMQRMPVAVALLIQFLAPVLLVGFVWLRTRRAPSRLVIAGSIIAIAGLVLVVDVTGARFDPLGALLALGAAVCVCVYFVMAERTGDHLPPLALAAGGLVVGALFMGLLAVTGILPFRAPDVTVAFRGVEVAGWVPIVVVGVVATSLGYALGVMAVPRIGSRLASFVGLTEVLGALLYAWLLLGEVPAPFQFAGGAAILVGVILVRMDAEATAVSVPAEPLPATAVSDSR